jgi:hypothetical protein
MPGIRPVLQETRAGREAERWADAAVAFMQWNAMRGAAPATPSWDRAAPPMRSPGFVVADGLGTSSTGTRHTPPWLPVVEPVIKRAAPNAEIGAFSYAGHRRHYGPRHTNLPAHQYRERVESFCRSIDAAIGWVAFSFAGPVLAVGLADMPADAPVGADLLLVQPALTLRPAVVAALERWRRRDGRLVRPRGLAWPLLELADGTVARATMAALGRLAGRMRVLMLYWADDELVGYDGIAESLAALGVETRPVSGVVFAQPQPTPFHEHCNVARTDAMLRAIEVAIDDLVRRRSAERAGGGGRDHVRPVAAAGPYPPAA